MGAFLGQFAVRGRLIYRPFPNYLMYRGQELALAKMLNASGSLVWKIGFAGPQYRVEEERPNTLGGYTISRDSQISEFEAGYGNEGGHPHSDAAALMGYERQSVAWTVSADGDAAGLVDTGWHTWASQLTWEQHGNWSDQQNCNEAGGTACWKYGADPNNCCWDEELLGDAPKPYKWSDATPGDPDVGFPWQTPSIEPHWLVGDIDWKGNEFGDCAHCAGHGAWSMSYPVGAVFVTCNDVLFAAAQVSAPVLWRFGGSVSWRYIGRISA